MGQMESAFREIVREEVAPLREQVSALLAELRSRGSTRQPALPAVGGNEYFTRKQAAEIMNCSPKTLSRRIQEGRLRLCGPRGDRISRFEIDRFMSQTPEPQGTDDDDFARDADQVLEG